MDWSPPTNSHTHPNVPIANIDLHPLALQHTLPALPLHSHLLNLTCRPEWMTICWTYTKIKWFLRFMSPRSHHHMQPQQCDTELRRLAELGLDQSPSLLALIFFCWWHNDMIKIDDKVVCFLRIGLFSQVLCQFNTWCSTTTPHTLFCLELIPPIVAPIVRHVKCKLGGSLDTWLRWVVDTKSSSNMMSSDWSSSMSRRMRSMCKSSDNKMAITTQWQ